MNHGQKKRLSITMVNAYSAELEKELEKASQDLEQARKHRQKAEEVTSRLSLEKRKNGYAEMIHIALRGKFKKENSDQ